MTESFPRQQARTRHFTLGLPRSFQISPSGDQVAFLRSRAATTRRRACGCLMRAPATSAWSRTRRCSVPASRARPSRRRPAGSGSASRPSASSPSPATPRTAWRRSRWPARCGWRTWRPAARAPRAIPARPGAFDPRPDPAGQRVAYVCDGAVRVVTLDSGADDLLIGPDGEPGVMFGLAEFVAAEEMGRTRGYWWAPDGTAVLVARVDETPVQRWHIADPANPGRAPREVGYPAAGTPNADVSLVLAGLDGSRAPVEWDRAAFPYLVTVNWDGTDPLIVVQSPRSAPDAAAVRRPGTGHHGGAAGGHRRALGRHRARRARLDQRRPDRVDGRRRGRQAAACGRARGTHRRHRGAGYPGGPPGTGGRRHRRRHRAVHRVGQGPDGGVPVGLRPRRAGRGHPGARSEHWPSCWRGHRGPAQVTGGARRDGDRAHGEPSRKRNDGHLARRAPFAACAAPRSVHRGRAGGPHRAGAALLAPAGLGEAAGADGSLRRAGDAAGGRRAERVRGPAVVRRAGVRRGGGGRPRHAGPRAWLGPRGGRGPGRAGP